MNVLIALSDQQHSSHAAAAEWHSRIGESKFYLCPVTESGLVRLSSSPKVGGKSIAASVAILQEISILPHVFHLPVAPSWLELVTPFASRLHGYRQVTDALLLGLAVRNGAILVTFDRAIQALAGEAYAANLLTLA